MWGNWNGPHLWRKGDIVQRTADGVLGVCTAHNVLGARVRWEDGTTDTYDQGDRAVTCVERKAYRPDPGDWWQFDREERREVRSDWEDYRGRRDQIRDRHDLWHAAGPRPDEPAPALVEAA